MPALMTFHAPPAAAPPIPTDSPTRCDENTLRPVSSAVAGRINKQLCAALLRGPSKPTIQQHVHKVSATVLHEVHMDVVQLRALAELRLRMGEPVNGSSRRSERLAEEEELNDETELIEVALRRDCASGSLGIDVDEYEHLPTIAAIVGGGAAEKEGSLCVGDVITKIEEREIDDLQEVLEALARLSASPVVHMEVRRSRARMLAAQSVLQRSFPLGATADEAAEATWSTRRCELGSNRRLELIAEEICIDGLLAAEQVDLAAAISIHLVICQSPSSADEDFSCLQVCDRERTYEMHAPSACLAKLQPALEHLISGEFRSLHQGWLWLVDGTHFRRAFLDLSSSHQLRAVVDGGAEGDGPSMHVIEIVELLSIAVRSPSVFTAGAHAEPTLQLSSSVSTLSFTSSSFADLELWASKLLSVQAAARASTGAKLSMLLADGVMEYEIASVCEEAGREDGSSASGYFTFDIGHGLRCYEEATLIESVPLCQLVLARRSPSAPSGFEIVTSTRGVVAITAPSAEDALHWISTINLYCSADSDHTDEGAAPTEAPFGTRQGIPLPPLLSAQLAAAAVPTAEPSSPSRTFKPKRCRASLRKVYVGDAQSPQSSKTARSVSPRRSSGCVPRPAAPRVELRRARPARPTLVAEAAT